MYNPEKKEYYVLEYRELDKLVKDNTIIKYFKSLAIFEWENFSIHEGEARKDEDLTEVNDWLESPDNISYFSLSELLSFLAKKEIIPFGNYLITVCW